MAKKLLFLHIGFHKTGTTSIQKFLSENQQQLWDKHRILYPLSARPEKRWGEAVFGHHILYWSLIGKHLTDAEAGWRELALELSEKKPGHIVLSAEGLCRLQPDAIRQIRQRLSEYQVKIVIYLRNPLHYLVSGYKQVVKQGKYAGSFEQYMHQKQHLVEYSSILKAWSQIFGKENLLIRSYEYAVKNSSLLEDFCMVSEIPLQQESHLSSQQKRANVSVGDPEIKLIRLLNVLEGKKKNRIIRRLRNQIKKNRKLGKWLLFLGNPFLNGPVAQSVHRQILQDKLRDSLENLFTEYHLPPEFRPFLQV